MSKKINTTSIGLFIVTGLALGVTGLLLFSSSKMFRETSDVIVYFDDSLNGLNIGAPVKFRGVTIGSVKKVMVQSNQAEGDYAMPVILEIDEQLVRERMPSSDFKFSESTMDKRIEQGMRATLQTESLVTGVLYVGIDVDPKAPPPVFHQLTKTYPEVPTIPTKTQQLFNNLASMDFKSLETNLNGLITRLDKAVAELKMAEINTSVNKLLASANEVITSANDVVSNPDIADALAAIKPTLDQYRELGAKVTNRVDPLADGVTDSLAEANRVLAEVRGSGENLKNMIAPNSPIRNDVDRALKQIADATEAIATLADFLKRHPNAIITGREIPTR
jgi:paraquat-inducible protein B